MQTFDDFDQEDDKLIDYKPFQFRDEKDDEATLKWLNDNFHYSYMNSRTRLMSYRRFANRYKNAGNSTSGGLVKTSNRDQTEVDLKPKIRTNFFYSYVEQKVSQVSRQKQNPVFIPLNDTEIDDLNNAEACNALVKFRMKEVHFDELMMKQDRMTFKYGTSFARIYWDPCAGPMNPKYEAAKKKYGKVPKLDEKGKKAGEISDYQAKLGDVMVEIIDSDSFFPERKKKKFEKLDFCEYVEMVPLEELKAEYGDDVKKENYYWLDVEQKGLNDDDMAMKHYFFHRPTKHLEGGEVIIYVEGKILERITDPEKVKDYMPDGELPFVPDFDVDVDDEFWARPFLVNIEQLNNLHDLVQSGMARNIGVASHPKIAVPEGTVNLKQLNNEYGVVQYRGPTPPQWLQHNYVNKGEFEIQDRAEKKMDLMAKVYDVSKGYVPPGVTAFSAIRYLDDQEVQANSTTIDKRRKRIMKIYWKVMKMMDRHYKMDDGRVIRILGENNSYLIQSFEKFDFSKIYSVDMENISALSDTRSGKISDIIDINAANQKEPTFGKKEISKILDLGLEKGFQEELSYAPVTAKTLLELLKNGKPAPAPEETDDLIEMYTIFSRFVESLAYKTKLDAGRKFQIQEYVKGLEYLMTQKAQRNMVFAELVRNFSKFPMFFKPGSQITMAPPAAPAPGAGGAPGPKAAPFKNIQEKAMNEVKTENGGQE
jgi:hypothetical protein